MSEFIFHCDSCGKSLGTYLYGNDGVNKKAWIGKIPLVGLPDIICNECLDKVKITIPEVKENKNEKV